MKLKINEMLFICCGFFFLTLSNSMLLIRLGKNEIVAYVGLAFILMGEFLSFMKMDSTRKKKDIAVGLIMFVLLAVGIYLQEMDAKTKVNLVLSVLIISLLATGSENIFKSQLDLKRISSAILLVIPITSITAIITGESLLTRAFSGAFSSFGFNGGLEHKNFCAFAILAAFIGDYICYRSIKTKNDLYRMRMICELILILTANSNGAYLCLAFFLVICNFDKIKYIVKRQRKFLLLSLFIGMCVFGYLLFKSVALNTTTYLYRFRGMLNYFNYYSDDWFHLLFGDAAMAFTNYASGMDYVTKVRSVLGWDGSLEIAWINVLLKSGILGIGAYIIYFDFIRRKLKKIKDGYWKYVIMSIFLTLLLSTLVESLLTNTKMVFGTYCYVVLLGLIGYEQSKKRNLCMPRLFSSNKTE